MSTDIERADAPSMLVRLRPGAGVREGERAVHLVPVPDAGAMPVALIAWCGEELDLAAIEVLRGFHGMPCTACLANSPTSIGGMLRRALGSTRAVDPLFPPELGRDARVHWHAFVEKRHKDQPMRSGARRLAQTLAAWRLVERLPAQPEES